MRAPRASRVVLPKIVFVGVFAGIGVIAAVCAWGDIVGFSDPTKYQVNSNQPGVAPLFSGDAAVVTTQNAGLATSLWYKTKQNITLFWTTFDYTLASPADPAATEGITWCIQNKGVNALGEAGGGRGYYGNPPGPGFVAPTPSVMVSLNINPRATYPLDFGTPTGSDVQAAMRGPFDPPVQWYDFEPAAPVNFHSGHPIRTTITYDVKSMLLEMADLVTGDKAQALMPLAEDLPPGVTLPLILGGTTAYVGFTGSTSGLPARQVVNNFAFRTVTNTAMTWKGTAAGDWGSANWTPGSSFPGPGVPSVINTASTVTVEHGQDRGAYTLNVSNNGRVVVAGDSAVPSAAGRLAVTRDANFAAGTTLVMNDNATFSAHGGYVANLTLAGNATVESMFADLGVGALSNSAAGTFTKRGVGSLSLLGTIAAPNTVFRVESGVLRTTAPNPLGGAAGATLAGGTLQIIGAPVLTPDALAESWFRLPAGDSSARLDPIDSNIGLLTEVPDLSLLLQGPLDYNDASIAARGGGIFDIEGGNPANPAHLGGLWYGTMTVGGASPLPAGDITLSANSDDGSVVWVDLDQSGRFEHANSQGKDEMVVANNGNHGTRMVTSTVSIPTAGTYDIAIGYFENGGGATMQANFGAGAATTALINPADIAQKGIWAAKERGPVDANFALTVAADSTLEIVGNQTATFPAITMLGGVLTTQGATGGITLGGVNIVNTGGPSSVGFRTNTPTALGVINGNGADVTISTDGSAPIILDTVPTGLTNAGWNVKGGLTRVLGMDKLGDAPVKDIAVTGGTMEVVQPGSTPATSLTLGGGTFKLATGGGAALDASAMNVAVTADSSLVLDQAGGATVKVGALQLAGGVLTVAGANAGIEFASTAINHAAVGVDLQTPAQLKTISVNTGGAATMTKAGPADLVLTPANVGNGFDRLTLGAAGGRLVGLPEGGNPFDAAQLRLSGGEVLLSGNAGASPVTYDNPVTVTADSTLTAGKGGVAAAADGPVTLDAPLTLSAGKLSVRAPVGYDLTLAQPLSGTGGLAVTAGVVNAVAGGAAGDVSAQSGATLNLGADLAVSGLAVTSGAVVNTGASRAVISNKLNRSGTAYIINSGNTFVATGANLAAAADLTVSGGTLTIESANVGVGYIEGFGDGSEWSKGQAGQAQTYGVPRLVNAGEVQMTTANNDEATSFFFNTRQDATFFDLSFDYRIEPPVPGNPADGIALVIQDNAANSVGGGGGGMGYAGMGKSFAVLFDIYGGGGSSPDTTGRGVSFAENGVLQDTIKTPGTPNDFLGLDPTTGDTIHATILYDGAVVSLDLKNLTTLAETHQEYAVTIPALLGSADKKGYVGFTGATGGANADQRVFNFSYRGIPGPINDPTCNIRVTEDSSLLSAAMSIVLGDLAVDAGRTLTLSDGKPYGFGDVTLGDGAKLVGGNDLATGDSTAVIVNGRVGVSGSDLGTVTFDVPATELADSAALAVRVGHSRTVEGVVVGDLVQVTGDGSLGGGLEVGAASMVKDPNALSQGGRSWGSETRTVVQTSGEAMLYWKFDPTKGTQAGDYIQHGVLFESVAYDPIPGVDPGPNNENGVAAVSVNVYQAAPGDTVASPANPGDPVVAKPDKQVNADDIQQILAAAKFNSGTPADWSQGDFNDDGACNGDDIQLILASALFNAGPYAAVGWAPPTTANGDDDGDRWAVPTLRVTPAGLAIDTLGATINGYVITSRQGVLTGAAADNLGLFTEDSDSRISGQMFFALNGLHDLGPVLGQEWTGVDLSRDLSMTYTIEGRAGIYSAAVVVPEPTTIVMLIGAALAALLAWQRRRA